MKELKEGVGYEAAVADGTIHAHLGTLQGDVDDLSGFWNATTNHKSWWLEGVVAGDGEIATQAGGSTTGAAAEGKNQEQSSPILSEQAFPQHSLQPAEIRGSTEGI